MSAKQTEGVIHLQTLPGGLKKQGRRGSSQPRRPAPSFQKSPHERNKRAVVAVEVGFRDDLIRRVHGDDGHADIHRVDVHVGDVLSDRPAAADVHLAEFRRLPDDALLCKHLPDFAQKLCRGIVGAALAARTRELADARPARDHRGVLLLVCAREVGVISRRHVCGEALGGSLHLAEVGTEGDGDLLHQVLIDLALQPRRALAADLLLVDEHGKHGMLALVFDDGHERGIGAHPVVVAVGTDERPVEADVARLEGGNGGELGGEEVLLAHPVFLVEDGEHGELDLFLDVLIRIGEAADEHVELLALDDLGGVLRHLLGGEVGEKVVDVEHGVVLVLAHLDLDLPAVLQDDGAVQGEGDGGPLILLDAAVVVRL